ncbi:MAG: deoxyribose-phosphate aldolase [Bacteroidota bacterium]
MANNKFDFAHFIDHAVLHPTATEKHLIESCQIAVKYQVTSICVKPCHVKKTAELTQISGVPVSTVIGFPHGSNSTDVKVFEAQKAIADGAVELDMVANIGAVLSGDQTFAGRDIAAVLEVCRAHQVLLKVIFENDFLPDDTYKIELCRICSDLQVDFVKTSTGFGYTKQANGFYQYRGATEHDVALMRQHCPPEIGVKASGGIRDLATLKRMVKLGATRIGTSSTAKIASDFMQIDD